MSTSTKMSIDLLLLASQDAYQFLIDSVEADLPTLSQQIQQLSAEVALLKAQKTIGAAVSSPWLPLKVAALLLNFKSPRALRARINNGQFPPECFRIDPTTSGLAVRYLIHVERYVKQLR